MNDDLMMMIKALAKTIADRCSGGDLDESVQELIDFLLQEIASELSRQHGIKMAALFMEVVEATIQNYKRGHNRKEMTEIRRRRRAGRELPWAMLAFIFIKGKAGTTVEELEYFFWWHSKQVKPALTFLQKRAYIGNNVTGRWATGPDRITELVFMNAVEATERYRAVAGRKRTEITDEALKAKIRQHIETLWQRYEEACRRRGEPPERHDQYGEASKGRPRGHANQASGVISMLTNVVRLNWGGQPPEDEEATVSNDDSQDGEDESHRSNDDEN